MLTWHYRVAALAGMLLAVLTLAAPARAQEDVPFVTTPDRVTLAMLEIAGVGPSDRLVDLGSGDGRIVITAARRFGARGLGVEIVPDLVQRSRETAMRAGVAGRVEFREQDLFKTDLSGASVVTMYLLPEVNLQMRPALLALAPGTRIVSHDWDMGDWQPDRSITLEVPEKTIGREKLSRVHLWLVPAPVQGLWCGPAGLALRLQQRFQQIDGQVRSAAGALGVSGRLAGASLVLNGVDGQLRLRWSAAGHPPGPRETLLRGSGHARLRVEAATGRLRPWAGRSVQRAADGTSECSGEIRVYSR